ncbi:MAG: MFS transporter [Candidatus Kapaibacterium sp.]|nr:MAG: MFS transporter [Candidatus Kapabacteria bacterium]
MTATMQPRRFFYGWIVLGAIFLIYASGTIGVTTIPLLNVKLRTELGLDHAQIALGPSLLFFIMACLSPFAGIFLDTLNPKRLLIIGWVSFIGALCLYSQIHSFWQYMVFYGLYALGSVCTGVIPGIYLISKWFRVHRGIATGIFTVGSSFGGTIFPRIAGYFMQTMSWQETALAMAGVTAAFAVIPWLFVRLTPESMNTVPDGGDARSGAHTPNSSKPAPAAAPKTDETLADAFRSLDFYLILLITAAVWFSIQPLIQHLSFHLKDIGVEPSKAGAISSTLFFCSIFGKLFFGWLSDYADKKNILLIATLNLATGAFLVRQTSFIPEEWLLYTAAVVYGLGFSGSFTMVQLLVAERYSASTSFGKILGFVTTADSFAVVAGVSLLGFLRTSQGSYTFAFGIMVAAPLVAMLCVLALKQLSRSAVVKS